MIAAAEAEAPVTALVNNAAGNFLARSESCRRAPSMRWSASC